MSSIKISLPSSFRINNWNYKTFIALILTTLIIYDVLIFLNVFFKIELFNLHSFLGLIIILLIPGHLILRILKIHDIQGSLNLLLTVALSITFIILYGISINFFLPLVGVSNPLSSQMIIISYNIAIFCLLVIGYFYQSSHYLDNSNLSLEVTPTLLVVIILPILSILGAYLFTYYYSNYIQILLLILLSISPILCSRSKNLEQHYPFVIFVIALSLLLHVNLVSSHLWSFDIFLESYCARTVIENEYWDPNLDYKLNSLLLINILAPVLSSFCDISYVWVFKAIFPLIFSLVPVSLFILYKNLIYKLFRIKDIQLAFLSTFVFVFYYGFFKDMPDKQHISQLFLSLIFILFLLKMTNSKYLILMLSFSLIVSHYGVAYLFALSLFGALILTNVCRYFGFNFDSKDQSFVTLNFTLLFISLLIAWYLYVASGSELNNIILVGKNLYDGLNDIFYPDERSGIKYLSLSTESNLWLLLKLTQLLIQAFIFIGFTKLLVQIIARKQNYFAMASLILIFYLFVLAQIIVTYGMGFDRIMQITLVLLSPLTLVGFKWLAEISDPWLLNRFKCKNYLSFFGVFLMFSFLLSSGVLFEIADDRVPPYCISLNKSAGWPIFEESEVESMIWLRSNNLNSEVAAINPWQGIKSRDGLLMSEFYLSTNIIKLSWSMRSINKTTLIYLSEKTYLLDGDSNNRPFDKNVLSRANKVYSSNKSNIFFYT